MRINIDTHKKPVTDEDVRTLYLLVYAIDNSSSEKMKVANLQYLADRMGFKLVKK